MNKFTGYLLAACFLGASVSLATSWEAPTFSNSVNWASHIAIGKVTKVKRIDKSKDKSGLGSFKGYADLRVEVIETLKGDLPENILVTRVDLGDPETMSSPFLPLPDELKGLNLLFFLRETKEKGSYEAYLRLAVEGEKVVNSNFIGLAGTQPLKDIRAMISELLPIQKDCPIGFWKSERTAEDDELALEACKKALRSKYDEVKWYGARRLLDRKQIPSDFIDDLTPLLEIERYRFLAFHCFAKANDMRAVPVLIKALKQYEEQPEEQKRFVDALKRLTGQDFQGDLDRWEAWWRKYKN